MKIRFLIIIALLFVLTSNFEINAYSVDKPGNAWISQASQKNKKSVEDKKAAKDKKAAEAKKTPESNALAIDKLSIDWVLQAFRKDKNIAEEKKAADVKKATEDKEAEKASKVTDSINAEEANSNNKKIFVRRFVRAFGLAYEKMYPTANQDETKVVNRKNDESYYEPIYAISRNDVLNHNVDTKGDSIVLKRKSQKEVFGFHPFWSDKYLKQYDYSILTSLAYFAYELDPMSGGYKSIRDWENSSVIDDALKSNTKVYLTVTNLERQDNIDFFSSQFAQNTSIDSISSLLNRRKAHGVVIDFENVPISLGRAYTNYIEHLSSRLKGEGKKIAVALPGNLSEAFNLEKLNPFVDYFIVMGKNYFYKVGEPAGPVAPLNEVKPFGKKSLTQSVADYLKRIPPEKFILSLPYYGFKWETETDALYSISKDLERLSYDEIISNYGDRKVEYDSISESAYYKYTDHEGKHFQIWYDDAKTLGKKYDLIKEQKLAGAGIWALSYDSNDNELWQLLDEKFGGGWEPLKPIEPQNEKITWLSIFKSLSVLKGCLLLGVIVFVLGFFLSMRNNQIRTIIFQNSILKNIILFGIPLLISILVYLNSTGNKMRWAVVTLMFILIGYGLYYLLIKADKDFKNLNRIP